MIFALIFVSLIVIYAIRSWHQYFTRDVYLKSIPGPKQLPVIKNTIEFMITPILDLFGQWFKEFGSVFQANIPLGSHFLAVSDPDLIQFILNSSVLIQKGKSYKFLHKWLGNGLITSSNPKWRQHRKLITPSFHLKILENFLVGFHTFEESLISTLEKEVGKDTVNVFPIVGVHTLAMICSTAMGTEIAGRSKFLNNINSLTRIFMERLTSPIKSIDSTYYFTPTFKEERETLDSVCQYTNFVISSRKKQIKETPSLIDLSIDEIGTKTKLSFLDTLLKQQTETNYLNDDDIREEVQTFMLAGYETTASSISFLLYTLAQYPDVQEKVVEELRCILGDDKNRQITKEDLNEMKYFEMVIKETLRLYPVAPIITRHVPEPVTYGNVTIPAGIELVVSIFHLHRNPEIYEDPERFDPERFSPENTRTRHAFAYIPFSAGMRNCIGQRYAYLNIKSLVSKILRNFVLVKSPTDTGLEVRGDLFLRSVNGMNISLRRRNF